MAIKKVMSLLIVLSMAFVVSCNIKKPYVGLKINRYYPLMAKIEYFPASVVLESEGGAFAFDVQIYKKKTTNEVVGSNKVDKAMEPKKVPPDSMLDEYRLTGGMSCNGKGGFSHIMPETFEIKLLLIKDGIVIDTLALNPIGVDLDHRMPYKKNFKSSPFDAIAITYGGYVRG